MVVACSGAAVVLEAVDESLDAIAYGIDCAIDGTPDVTVAFGGDPRPGATYPDVLGDRVSRSAVVRFAGRQYNAADTARRCAQTMVLSIICNVSASPLHHRRGPAPECPGRGPTRAGRGLHGPAA
jgi:hypothetical protein